MSKQTSVTIRIKSLIRLYCVFFLFFHTISAFSAITRNIDPVGSIISTKGQEHIRLVKDHQWLNAEITQTLTSGDALKTGRYGGLAILFRDETQIRIHNNSFLVIKDIAKKNKKNNTLLKLDYGRIWMRAITQPDKLQVDTPSASLAVRGTDWAVTVDKNGRSQLVVLEGKIHFYNALGSVVVKQGEAAVAEIGKPPRKIFLIKPEDKPYWDLILTAEWIELFLSPKQSSSELKARQTTLEMQLVSQLTDTQLLELAEVSFNLSDIKKTKYYLKKLESRFAENNISPDGRIDILWGLIELRQSNNTRAQSYFNQVSRNTDKKYFIMGKLGLVATLIQQKQYLKAEELLKKLEKTYGYLNDTYFLRIVLASFRGDQHDAILKCKKAQKLFPKDVRFHAFLAHLYLLQGDAGNMKKSIDKAINMDPNVAFVWHWLGLYYQGMMRENQKAIHAYNKALQLNPNSMATWHNLSIIYLGRTEYNKAETAISKSIEAAPNIALPYASYALLLMVTDRLDEAEKQLKIAFDIDPGNSEALLGMGILSLLRGKIDKSIVMFEKAIVSNPNYMSANTSLGEAFYQSGRVHDARKLLTTAKRLDPHNPYPSRDLAIIAIDRAQVGDAIRYAKESYEKNKKLGHADFTDSRSIQDSASVTYSAYSQLGLNDWGDSFNQKSFTPYLPGGYLANSVQLDSDIARRSSLIQGELIDPLSIAQRNRYADFWRRPFNDFSISVGIGDEDGAFTDTESLTLQGFSRSRPVSYQLNATRSHKDGFRKNSHSDFESISLKLGTTLDKNNALIFNLAGTHYVAGLPGTTILPTINDSTEDYLYEASLGYRLRISPTNFIFFRASGGYAQSSYENDKSFGLGLSDLDSSLINGFGVNGANSLLEQGLCDIRSNFGSLLPVYMIESFSPFFNSSACALFGHNVQRGQISQDIDLRRTNSIALQQSFFALQYRHMFDIESFKITYGAEWIPSNIVSKVKFTTFEQNNNDIAALGFFNDFFGFIPAFSFPFGNDQLKQSRNEFNRDAIMGYIKGRWTINSDLWIESSLQRSYYHNENINLNHWDPSVGIAYKFNLNHWLRIIAQSKLFFDYQPEIGNILGRQQGSLAPTTNVGIAPSDAYLTDGSSSSDYIIRWDAEWSNHLFTFVQLGERHINRFQNLFTVDKGRIRNAEAGINVWFAERFGFSSSYQYYDTENRSSSLHRGNELPLIAKHNFTASLNYVHPKQFRATINQTFTSSRSANIENTEQLPDFWSTNLFLNWQPFDKHFSFNFTVNNLFNKKNEQQKNIPLPGRTVFFSMAAHY